MAFWSQPHSPLPFAFMDFAFSLENPLHFFSAFSLGASRNKQGTVLTFNIFFIPKNGNEQIRKWVI